MVSSSTGFRWAGTRNNIAYYHSLNKCPLTTMPKQNTQPNAVHQREKHKQGIISLEEAASLVKDPTYSDTETIDSFDADIIRACTAVLDLEKNT